ncbi:MAG TPA: hypothetical protein VFY06_02375 [Verrucomicrobiae bacterium]|nr:hypothetical protein [Verrucomicrobiae bacterium]
MKKNYMVTILALFAGWHLLADETPSSDITLTHQSPTTVSGSHRLGAGLVFGEPTGPTVKYWLNDTMAVDGTLGWSLQDDDNIYLNADILWHNFDLIPVSRGKAPVYFGVGPSIEFRDNQDNRFGVRAPVGVSYMFENKPLDVFVEVAPILDFSPELHGDINVGIGVRYWF